MSLFGFCCFLFVFIRACKSTFKPKEVKKNMVAGSAGESQKIPVICMGKSFNTFNKTPFRLLCLATAVRKHFEQNETSPANSRKKSCKLLRKLSTKMKRIKWLFGEVRHSLHDNSWNILKNFHRKNKKPDQKWACNGLGKPIRNKIR